MLKERHLAATAALIAVCGIALIAAANALVEYKETSIAEIDGGSIGKRVLVFGHIEWALQKDNFVLLTLNDGAKIKVVAFSPTKEERAILARGAYVSVKGTVKQYKNEIEIVAEEVNEWKG